MNFSFVELLTRKLLAFSHREVSQLRTPNQTETRVGMRPRQESYLENNTIFFF